MGPENSTSSSLLWLLCALVTVFCFGVYGNLLHSGQMGMSDSVNGRYKAFLFVGVAYFLVAVLAPLMVLLIKGASFQFPAKGMGLSLVAGCAGAVGALFILLAFGAKGTPAVVMSIVFAGAPIINAFVSIWLHPPHGGLTSIKPQFFFGILLAALGGFMVTYFKPNPPAPKAHSSAPLTAPSSLSQPAAAKMEIPPSVYSPTAEKTSESLPSAKAVQAASSHQAAPAEYKKNRPRGRAYARNRNRNRGDA